MPTLVDLRQMVAIMTGRMVGGIVIEVMADHHRRPNAHMATTSIIQIVPLPVPLGLHLSALVSPVMQGILIEMGMARDASNEIFYSGICFSDLNYKTSERCFLHRQ